MTISVVCTFAAVVCGIVWFHCLGDWSQWLVSLVVNHNRIFSKITTPAFWANVGSSFGSDAEIWKQSREKDFLIVSVQVVIVCVCGTVYFLVSC